MKLLLCFVCLASVARGQAPVPLPLDPVTHRIHYQAVVPVAGVSQPDLLTRACGWATGAASPTTPPVITHEQDTDVLAMSGTLPFIYTYSLAGTANGLPRTRTNRLVLHYTVRLHLREGHYLYQVTDFAFAWPAAATPEPAESEFFEMRALNEEAARSLTAERTRFQQATATLLTQLQDAMSNPNGQSAVR
ncbi:hypothetical protein [Hymenobacter yonginensis]|uniref:DUF4468 domain-containing protein n=1 Tax=Hymenobacter yonginensis TaxID=748197 RepID=A0ABY7PV03_9BACT|nr:hypothetical protein [Hymenobacter yonginensis]WBO86740.1 hypothetical protein O9Z63_20885 [Hymenobacter yonginensis]